MKQRFPCRLQLTLEVFHEHQHCFIILAIVPGVFQVCQARLGKAWSRSGNTAPIVVAPDGGPRAGWTPASQRSTLLGLSHSQSGLHCQGRARDVFPS